MQVFRKIGLGISAMLVSFSAFADYSWNFPTPATPMALDTLHVHNKFMLISMAIFVSVLVIMIYSIFSHRKSKNFKAVADKAPSTAVEIFWTLIPFVILLLIDFVIMGIPAYHSVVMMENTREKAEMVIKITGSQWRWQYEYLDGDAKGIKFVSNLSTPKEQTDKGFDGKKDEHYLLEVDKRLVLPEGKKVSILMTSTDVLHNWWVPQFGSSRVAVPGFLRENWVQVEKEGAYRGQCKELCGKSNGYLQIVVDAIPADAYKAWVSDKTVDCEKASEGGEKEWTE